MSEDRPQGPIRVPISRLDLGLIAQHAEQRTTELRQHSASYGHVSVDGNTVGLLGEYAVHHWLSTHATQPKHIEDGIAEDAANPLATFTPLSDWDIRFHPRRVHASLTTTVEVKTNRATDWKKYGRTLNAHQLSKTRAHTYVWCVVADELPTTSVLLMGWCVTQDLLASTGQRLSPVRATVRATAPMRPMPDLLTYVGWDVRR